MESFGYRSESILENTLTPRRVRPLSVKALFFGVVLVNNAVETIQCGETISTCSPEPTKPSHASAAFSDSVEAPFVPSSQEE